MDIPLIADVPRAPSRPNILLVVGGELVRTTQLADVSAARLSDLTSGLSNKHWIQHKRIKWFTIKTSGFHQHTVDLKQVHLSNKLWINHHGVSLKKV